MSMPESPIPNQNDQRFGVPVESKGPKNNANDYKADRLTRFLASLIDAILIMLINVPIQIATGHLSRQMAQNVSIAESLAMTGITVLVFALLQGYLLYSRGQTVGKMLLGIQIVDSNSGRLLPFFRVFFLRYYWLMPFMLLMMVFPVLNPFQLGGLFFWRFNDY